MTKILKNILLTLATTTMLVTPIITVVSCTGTDTGTGDNNGNVTPPVDGGGIPPVTPPPVQKPNINILNKKVQADILASDGTRPLFKLGGGTYFPPDDFPNVENYNTDPSQIYNFNAKISIPKHKIKMYSGNGGRNVVYDILPINRQLSFDFKFDKDPNKNGEKAIFLVGDNPGYIETEIFDSPHPVGISLKSRSILTVPTQEDNTFIFEKYDKKTNTRSYQQMQYQIKVSFDEIEGLRVEFFPMSVENMEWAYGDRNSFPHRNVYNISGNPLYFDLTFSLTPKA